MSWLLTICFVLFCIANSLSIPKSNRVTVKPFSDEVHFENDNEHNPEYDHDAFLGEEEANEFDDLSPEESKEKLAILFDKIDTDHNDYISEEEMQAWIRRVQNQDSEKDSERKWSEIQPKLGDKITWDEYEFFSYGTKESIESSPDQKVHELIKKDKRRWVAADGDKDDLLTKQEFTAFLYPESTKEMEDVVAEEALEEIDSNNDGYIDLQEFIDDMDVGDNDDDDNDDNEWIESEKQNFADNLDKNRDGKLDRDEVKRWLMSEEWDQVNEETEHLFEEADVNKDKYLSKDEILDKYDLFVGSQATDYGDLFNRHDEF